MFAIIEDGNRQYRVSHGDTLTIDYRDSVNDGDSVSFDRVLLASGGGSSAVGRPVIEGASVAAEVVTAEYKGPKLEIQKLRRRKNSRRHTGHRQRHTVVKITDLTVPGIEAPEPPAEESSEEPPAEVTSDAAPTEATSDESPAEESAETSSEEATAAEESSDE